MSRVVPAAMRRAMADGVSRFCHCWLIARRDGTSLGLTEHDRQLHFNGQEYLPEAALSLSALETQIGLNAPAAEAQGVLSNTALKADDLTAGLYDDASFDVWLVDWQQTDNRMLLMSGRFDAVRVDGDRFSVALLPHGGAVHARRGRVYQTNCDAALGDGRCRATIDGPPWRYELAVEKVATGHIDIAALDRPTDWFTHGYVATATGQRFIIRQDARLDGRRRLHLWLDATPQIKIGDEVQLVAGCDKSLTTCRDKFDNAVNYQGFPHLSDDALLINIGGVR